MVVGCGGNSKDGSSGGDGSSNNKKLYCSIKHSDILKQTAEVTYFGDKATYAESTVEMTVPAKAFEVTKTGMISAMGMFDNIAKNALGKIAKTVENSIVGNVEKKIVNTTNAVFDAKNRPANSSANSTGSSQSPPHPKVRPTRPITGMIRI